MNNKSLIVSFNFPPTIGGIIYAKELMINCKDDENIDFFYPKSKRSNKSYLRGLQLIIFTIQSIFYCLKKNYNIIHLTSFNLWIFAFFCSKINKNTKFVINIWGLEFVYQNKKGLLPKIYNKIFLSDKLLNSPNFYYLVSSNASLKLLQKKGFSDNHIKLIKLGVTKNKIFEKSEFKYADEKYFLFVGRIIKRKGLSWFSNNVLPHFPGYKLKIVGPIGEQKEFQTAQRENIEYLGTVSDSELKKLRSNAVACVVPNIYLENEDDFEAFCFVTIEAVASASIVVASDYQGISEALLGGYLGYLAKPSDINYWVDILKEVISLKENERNELIKKDHNY